MFQLGAKWESRYGIRRSRRHINLLFAHGLMVEAKTVKKLIQGHQAQTLHYLLLAGTHHGLLVNLRPGKVEKQFVSTTLDLAERRRYHSTLDT